jgi:aryl-alcohol dehydrogenase-like predicted oxidoreductase
MEQRNVGQSGLRVSAIGLGCNNFGRPLDVEGARAVVHKALDLGVTFFDCADVYGGRGAAETIMGEILGTHRKDIVLVTKFGRPMDKDGRLKGGSRRYIMTAIEASLKRLKTDWIDLYQYHLVDPLTPVEETLRALDDLVHQGKVRYIGSSHMPGWQVVDSLWTSRTGNLARFIACEDEYNLISRGIEAELIPAIKAHGLGLFPYYPLASGMLTGKYKRGQPVPSDSRFAVIKERDYTSVFMTDTNLTMVEKLTAYGEQHGFTVLELAMAWLVSRPQVSSVIAGATKPEQVEANVKAAAAKLSADDIKALNAITAATVGGH